MQKHLSVIVGVPVGVGLSVLLIGSCVLWLAMSSYLSYRRAERDQITNVTNLVSREWSEPFWQQCVCVSSLYGILEYSFLVYCLVVGFHSYLFLHHASSHSTVNHHASSHSTVNHHASSHSSVHHHASSHSSVHHHASSHCSVHHHASSHCYLSCMACTLRLVRLLTPSSAGKYLHINLVFLSVVRCISGMS